MTAPYDTPGFVWLRADRPHETTVVTPDWPAVADLLDASAKILQRDGWCQNVMHTATGEHCVLGAISAAYLETTVSTLSGLDRDEIHEAYLARRYAEESVAAELRGRTGSGDIPGWNDDECRSSGEAEALLSDTAATIRDNLDG